VGRKVRGADSAGNGVRVIFKETKLKGTFVIEPERIEDERGFFARTFCRNEFEAHGLNPLFVQCSVSFNKKKGTLRGMHYQVSPHQEDKLIRCSMGAIYDVILDLRPNSPTFKQWVSVELTAENRRMIYIPCGMAQGFQSLVDNTEIFYQISTEYIPEAARGIRWNDPTIQIHWPMVPSVISPRDRSLPQLVFP
jgi:dTDP-4-dehydrorhamnose 3,5-epimerase